jgi:hypothetical protein
MCRGMHIKEEAHLRCVARATELAWLPVANGSPPFFFSNTQESYVSLYIKKKIRGVKPRNPRTTTPHTPHLTQKPLLAYYIKKDLTSIKKES